MNVVNDNLRDGDDSGSDFHDDDDNSSWSSAMEISDDDIDFPVAAKTAMNPPASDSLISKIKSQPTVHPSQQRNVVGTSLRQFNHQSPRHRSTSPMNKTTRIIRSSSPPKSPAVGMKKTTRTIRSSSPPKSPTGGNRGRTGVRSVSPIRTGGPRTSVRVQHPPQSQTKKKTTRVSPQNRTRLSREEVTPIHFTPRIREVSPLPKSNSTPEDMNRAAGSNKAKYRTSISPKRGNVRQQPPKISGGLPVLTPKITPKGSKKNRSLSPKKKSRAQSDDLSPPSFPKKTEFFRHRSSGDEVLLETDEPFFPEKTEFFRHRSSGDEVLLETDVTIDDETKDVKKRQKPRSRSLDREPSLVSTTGTMALKAPATPSSGASNKRTPRSRTRSQSPRPATKPVRTKSDKLRGVSPKEAQATQGTAEKVESDDEEIDPNQPVRKRSSSLGKETSAATPSPTQFSQMPKRNSTGSFREMPAGASRPRSSTTVKRRKSPNVDSDTSPTTRVPRQTSPEKPSSSKTTTAQSRSTSPKLDSGKSNKPKQTFKERPRSGSPFFGTLLSAKQPLKPASKDFRKTSEAPRAPKSSNTVFATSERSEGVVRNSTSLSPPRSNGTLNKGTSSSPPRSNGALNKGTATSNVTSSGGEPDAPIGDIGQAKVTRGRTATRSRSKSPMERASGISVKRRSGSSGPLQGRRSGSSGPLERSRSPSPGAGPSRRSGSRGPLPGRRSGSRGPLERSRSPSPGAGPGRRSGSRGPLQGRRSGSRGPLERSRKKDNANGVATDLEIPEGGIDGYQYTVRLPAKPPSAFTEPRRYAVRTRPWSARRDGLFEMKRGSVRIASKEIEFKTPPRGLVIVWMLMGIELLLDLIATIISFVSFVNEPLECCGEELDHDALHLGITIPFILLIIGEIGFLFRAIFLSLWPKSTYTLDGEVIITDEEVADSDARGVGRRLCCVDWNPKSIFWTVSLLTIVNAFFGFFITWVLLYQSDKNEALAVMGIEAVSILLHFIAVYVEKSAPTWKLKLLHMLAVVAWLATIFISLIYLQQGGVCYNSSTNTLWIDGCEVCIDGSVPVDIDGLKCPVVTVLPHKNITTYTPVFGLTLKHQTKCEGDVKMCWYEY